MSTTGKISSTLVFAGRDAYSSRAGTPSQASRIIASPIWREIEQGEMRSTRSSPGQQRSSPLVAGACIAFAVAGALATLGCVLALYVESSGLGSPRDTGMRPGYSALLIGGAVAGIALPAAVCFTVLRGSRRVVVVVAVLAAIAVALAVLRITG